MTLITVVIMLRGSSMMGEYCIMSLSGMKILRPVQRSGDDKMRVSIERLKDE